MLKKLISLVVVFTMLVSVSGRVMAEALLDEDEQDIQDIIEEARIVLQGNKNRSEFSKSEIETIERAIERARLLLLQRKKFSEFSEKITKRAGILPEKETSFIGKMMTVLSKFENVLSKLASMVDSIVTVYGGLKDLILGAKGASLESYRSKLSKEIKKEGE
ncbi:MAG: hypothetical protein LBT58_05235 [Endomicrobium sp.]|jgi:hypothetical protein|nr:hypothetical protein [Endomicrobium sp.]